MAKEESKEQKIAVVNELPTQAYNEVELEDGEKVTLITINQAITEMYQDIKEIKKALA